MSLASRFTADHVGPHAAAAVAPQKLPRSVRIGTALAGRGALGPSAGVRTSAGARVAASGARGGRGACPRTGIGACTAVLG